MYDVGLPGPRVEDALVALLRKGLRRSIKASTNITDSDMRMLYMCTYVCVYTYIHTHAYNV